MLFNPPVLRFLPVFILSAFLPVLSGRLQADTLVIPVSATFTGDSLTDYPPVIVPITLPAGSVITRLGYNTQVTVSSITGPDGTGGDDGFTIDFVLGADASTATGPDVYNYLFPNFLEFPQTMAYNFPVMPLVNLPYTPPDKTLPASIPVPSGQPRLMLFGYFYSPHAGVVVSGTASISGTFTIEYDAPPPFRILSVQRTGGQVALTWQSVATRQYEVQESPDMNAWATRHNVAASATTTSASITPTTFPGGRGFFRVQLVPVP